MNDLKLKDINERYITNKHLEVVLSRLDRSIFSISNGGASAQDKPIYRIDFGMGKFKVLLWSQMHGNEATTTKAVLDLVSSINIDEHSDWLNFFTFTFIPILNPDGAEAYTRVNANGVDLNRDSSDLTQPESRFLRAVFEDLKPDLALNMHDQRTIFSAGTTEHPATISFLAPSYNKNCEVNDIRFFAMQLIASMHDVLKEHIPNQIGRFDDAFNINCIGDMFTFLGVPTILFEAGHYPNDYNREKTREIVTQALIVLFNSIVNESYKKYNESHYLSIPQNEKNFVDVIIENYTTNNEELKKNKKLPIVFKEILVKDKVQFIPVLDFVSAPDYKYGHIVLDFNGLEINSEEDVQKWIKEIS